MGARVDAEGGGRPASATPAPAAAAASRPVPMRRLSALNIAPVYRSDSETALSEDRPPDPRDARAGRRSGPIGSAPDRLAVADAVAAVHRDAVVTRAAVDRVAPAVPDVDQVV